MHTLKTLGRSFSAPASWQEVTKEQLLFIIRLMNSGCPYDEIQFRMVVELFRIPEKKLTFFKYSRPARYRDYCADLLTATEGLFDFLFDRIKTDESEIVVISKKLTNQLLPEYQGFYGPTSGLSNVQIWEFTMAEAAFMDFVERKEPKHIDRLVATLYRPSRSDVDTWRASDRYNLDDRRIFNDQLIERDMEAVKRWPQEVKELIFIFFFSCREALSASFPKLYRNRLKKKGSGSASWTDIILQQARLEHKEAEQISERNMMIFLRQRELEIIDAEEQQDEIERIKNKHK